MSKPQSQDSRRCEPRQKIEGNNYERTRSRQVRGCYTVKQPAEFDAELGQATRRRTRLAVTTVSSDRPGTMGWAARESTWLGNARKRTKKKRRPKVEREGSVRWGKGGQINEAAARRREERKGDRRARVSLNTVVASDSVGGGGTN